MAIRTVILFGLMGTIVILCASRPVPAQEPASSAVKVGVEERLGTVLPLDDLEFRDEEGRPLKLRTLFDKPVALTLVYYRCPGICTPLLLELSHAVGVSDLKPGEDYRLVTISFDPTEDSELAKNKKSNMIAEVKGRQVPLDAWRFLVGDAENIRRITDLVGFRYALDKNQVDYVHAGTVIVLAADGTVVRYLNGVTVNPVEMKMAVLDAQAGRPRSFMRRVGELCYGYDPTKGNYVLKVNRIILAAMALLLAAFIVFLMRQGRRRKARTEVSSGGAP